MVGGRPEFSDGTLSDRGRRTYATPKPGSPASVLAGVEKRDNKLKPLDEVRRLGPARGLGDTMWQYEQFRAGKLYNKLVFNTRKEAEDFASEMAKMEPDLFCRIEPIEAKAIWN
jgi:hypothetical protein